MAQNKKQITDLFGSLPDFVLQGLGPNEIFNIIQQGDPFPGGPDGPGIGEGTFFDEVNQGDQVATQQEMIQAAINQLEQEDNGLPDAVRSAAEIVSALKGSYPSDSIEDVIVDLYGRDIWGDVQAEEKKREIELFGPGAFDIEKRTLETDEELNLHFDKILTQAPSMFSGNLDAYGYPDVMGRRVSPARMLTKYEEVPTQPPSDLPPQEEVSEDEMIEALNLPPVEPRGETWDSSRDLLRFLRDQENPAGLIGAVPQQQDMLKAYLMGFTPGLGAYDEVPTDFPNLSTADPDADRILRSLRPELGQEDIIEDTQLPLESLLGLTKEIRPSETPYQEDTRKYWERILEGGDPDLPLGSWLGPTIEKVPEKLAIPDDVTAIEKVIPHYQPPAVVGEAVPTTTAVPTTAPKGGSLSDFIQTRESFTPTENPKEFVSIDSLASDPENEILEIVDIGGGVKLQLLYNDETESVYARQDATDISPVTLYDLGKATSANEGNTLSLGSFKWNNEGGLWSRDEVVPTTAQGAVGLQPRGGRVSVADTFRDQGGRSAWKDFYELARLQGMGPQARQTRFAATASQGFGSKWGEFLLEQASLGKKGDLGFFDTYLQDEDRDISEANRNKGWGNIAQWSAYAGSDDQAERDKFYGTPHIARDVLTDSSKQDILDLISAAMGSNPDTYGGRALQRSLGRDYDHYVMQQQAKGFGEPKAGFIGFVHSQIKLNDFTEKDTVALEAAAAANVHQGPYSDPGIETQGSETELQRYFQGS